MQFPHIPPHMERESGPSAGIRLGVAATVAVALGGYALALGFTGIPVVIAALGGMIAGLVLLGALAD